MEQMLRKIMSTNDLDELAQMSAQIDRQLLEEPPGHTNLTIIQHWVNARVIELRVRSDHFDVEKPK